MNPRHLYELCGPRACTPCSWLLSGHRDAVRDPGACQAELCRSAIHPVNCNWCGPSCLMAFRQNSQVTPGPDVQLFLSLPFFLFWKQWFCLCFPGTREIIRVIPFAKPLTGFQNAQLCLVMTWFLSEVNNNSKKNGTGWGQCEWQKILSHRILQGMQSYYFRNILWRKSVTKNKRLWRRGCGSSQ